MSDAYQTGNRVIQAFSMPGSIRLTSLPPLEVPVPGKTPLV